VEQVKSVLERTRSLCSAIATEVGNFTSSVYRILANSMGKRKVCVQWNPLNDDERSVSVLLATAHLQHWRN
jgi:hypothetical protein